MRVLGKILKVVFILVLVVVVVGGVVLTVWVDQTAKSALPRYDATVQHASLQGEVQVLRDEWGVPHIKADHELDAYFTLGFCMAQDRLFQMELIRRLAAGQISEIVGSTALPIDQIVRGFRLLPKAEEYLAIQQDQYPEITAVSEAFVAGINHFMDTETLPFEYKVLGIPARHFTTIDCLSVGAILPISFADGLREDSLHSVLQARHPELPIADLFPNYTKGEPVTVMETIEEATAILRGEVETHAPAETPEDGGEAQAKLDIMEALLAALNPIAEHFGPAMGSNSWVLSGDRTQSGKPVLANDPHIAFTNPSIWYEAHITYPDFNWYGFHLALIPFSLIGHNENHAWGLTMWANDDLDLYRETFKEDDPNQVMYNGEWVAVQEETETIKVRFGDDVPVKVRVTPHGPVITDLMRLLMDYDGPDVAMKWVWQHLDYTDMVGFYRMARAKNIDEFEFAVALCTSPGLNVSYVDAEGNIAWWTAGRVPIRPDHINPNRLLDGASGKDEWLGYVDFADNPKLKNPPWGFIATANNRSTVKPVGAVKDLQGYWQPVDRAKRIEQALGERDIWDLDGLKALQFDDQGACFPDVVERMVEAMGPLEGQLGGVEKAALDALKNWDARHDTESTGASVFWVCQEYIAKGALLDEMGENGFMTYQSLADSWNFFKWFVQTEDSPFWDNVETSETETRQQIIKEAFGKTVATLRDRYGDDVTTWAWGQVHTMEFMHPFGYIPGLGGIFNIGPFPATGANRVINNMIFTGDDGEYKVVAGPSTRRLIDFASPEDALVILPTGNSGHFKSPHYDDQAVKFMHGEYRQAYLDWDEVVAHKKHEMKLSR